MVLLTIFPYYFKIYIGGENWLPTPEQTASYKKILYPLFYLYVIPNLIIIFNSIKINLKMRSIYYPFFTLNLLCAVFF